MDSTNFVNCTGLDAEGHLTTAHDVAIMSSELIKHELIKKYSTVWMDSLRNGESELVNTNKLVRFYEGTTGLKTCTTSIAKYCLSATAKRNGMELVAVVMAGDTSNDRFNGAKKLLDFGFANYSFSTIDAALKETEASVSKGTAKKIKVEAKDKLSLLLPKQSKEEIERRVEWEKNITAPIKKGQTLGNVNVYVGDELLGKLKITAKEDMKRLTPFITAGWILKQMFKL